MDIYTNRSFQQRSNTNAYKKDEAILSRKLMFGGVDTVHFGAGVMAPVQPTAKYGNYILARVVAKDNLTFDDAGEPKDEAYRIKLRVPRRYKWKPGQAANVLTNKKADYDRPEGPDNLHVAAYSIASAYNWWKGPEVELIVRRADIPGSLYPRARASNDLCDAGIGSMVKLLPPTGNKLVLENNGRDKNIVFIAGGTGISPFLSFVPFRDNKHLTLLIYGTQDPNNFLARDEVETFIKRVPSAKAMVAYSENHKGELGTREAQSHRRQNALASTLPDVEFEAGRVDVLLEKHDKLIWELLQDENTYFLFCGKQAMQDGVERSLSAICEKYQRETPQSGKPAKTWGDVLRERRWRAESGKALRLDAGLEV